MINLEETFHYDPQNPLTEVWIGASQTGSSTYDGYGCMTAKTADAQTVFSNAAYNTTAKPHAMDAATTFSWAFPTSAQTITHTGYDNLSHTFDRGFTLHEHYDGFDLINMNGRLYDPILGRMLSPDIVVQDDQSSQAYNRYSYCFNNPLRFTDPSGYVVTIQPEFVDMFLYAKDVEVFHDMISGLGINPSTVQYDTKEVTEGVQKTTVCWMIGEDRKTQ